MNLVRRTLRRGALMLAAVAGGACADTGNVTPAGFVSIFREEVKASPAQLWQATTDLPRWWSNEHTYSGQAARMTFDPQAGGCWCERWGDNNSVEHGHVVHAVPGRSLRLYANLGPLQELPVSAVLTFTIATQEAKTILRWTYRVSGGADAGLDKLAPLVDQVLGQQFRRLVMFAATGRAEYASAPA